MQKNTHYWILAAGCLGTFTFFLTEGLIQPSVTLKADIVTDTELCSDIVGYWKFDEGTGANAMDLSANANTAILKDISESDWSVDVSDDILFWNEYSMDFPGNGVAHVMTGTNLEITGDITISLWAKYELLSQEADANVLISYAGGTEETTTEEKVDNILYGMSLSGVDNKLRMFWENGNDARDIVVESSAVSGMSPVAWSHIVVTRDADEKEVRFYEDGNLLGSEQSYTIIPSGGTGSELAIGASLHDLSGTYFNGQIDDVRIYDKVLTLAEVRSLHQNSDLLTGCTCGNGELEPPEECDDGNALNTDECTNVCTDAVCGDGYVQDGEECEPPGTSTCDSSCQEIDVIASSAASEEQSSEAPPNCGNRIVNEDEGEECDNGHLNGKGDCSDFCTILYCGDGILSPEIDEECEPTPKSVVNGVPVFVEPTCGQSCAIPEKDSDGKIIAGCTRLFLPPCDVESSAASSAAQAEESSEELKSAAPDEPSCGNAVVDEGEQCDNGGVCEGGDKDGTILTSAEDVSDCIDNGGISVAVSNDGCSAECVTERCGDGIVQVNEQCDNGSVCTNADRSCSTDDDCVEEKECLDSGDDTLTCGGEEGGLTCTTSADCSRKGRCIYNFEAELTCTNACTSLTECGDGVSEGIEECDDGNTEDGDGCSTTCTSEIESSSSSEPVAEASSSPAEITSSARPAVCGNFLVEAGEECDDGLNNSDTEGGACRTDCTLPYCGDAIIDDDEECDNGEDNSDVKPDSCRNTCKLPTCGDGIRNSDEECDGGLACTDQCVFPQLSICGNGKIEGYEQCDDGNTEPGDGCSSTCKDEPKLTQATSSEAAAASSSVSIPEGFALGIESSTSSSEESPEASSATSSSEGIVAGGQFRFSQSSLPAAVSSVSSYVLPVVQVSVPSVASSSLSAFTLQPVQQPVTRPIAPTIAPQPIASLLPPPSIRRPPVGDTGPAAIIVVTGGAVSGFLWKRRRKKS